MIEIVKMVPVKEDNSVEVQYRLEEGGPTTEITVSDFTAQLIRAGMRQGRNQVRAQIRKALEAE